MDPKELEKIKAFEQTVWKFYKENARADLPWRQPNTSGKLDPYHILVSELMLQQTQVSRVIPKFKEFLEKFPSVEALAKASLGEVLSLWSGLGYNRRAKFLHMSTKYIVEEWNGRIAHSPEDLVMLPGVGANTAAAIAAYSFNTPVIFIETNIRTVFIHHFFEDHEEVSDAQILPYIESSLDPEDSRQWYWALMDYGSYLKSVHKNPSRKSKHHVVQSRFQGSKRQIRGSVLKLLLEKPRALGDLKHQIVDERLIEVLQDLQNEQLITFIDGTYTIGK